MTTAAKLREEFIRCFRPDYGEKPFQHHLDVYARAVWNEALEEAAKQFDEPSSWLCQDRGDAEAALIAAMIRALKKEPGHE